MSRFKLWIKSWNFEHEHWVNHIHAILFSIIWWMNFYQYTYFVPLGGLSILAISVQLLPSQQKGIWISHQIILIFKFHIKSSWSSRDRLRARRFSLRLSGRGGVLPLRNRTARALIFWQRSNICMKQSKCYGTKFFHATERTMTNNKMLNSLYRWGFYLGNTFTTLTTSF